MAGLFRKGRRETPGCGQKNIRTGDTWGGGVCVSGVCPEAGRFRSVWLGNGQIRDDTG